MNAKEKEVFRKLQQDLSGCDPKYFIAKLLENDILSEEDYETCQQRSTWRERMNEICQIIQRKGMLHAFIKALDEVGHYEFIVDKYKELTSQLGIPSEDKLSVDYNQNILSGVLRLGGVPNLPAKLLPRQSEVMNVQKGILKMYDDDDAILPVYCMAGGGKSVIVNQALRSQQLFNEIFNQGVYWVTIGKIEPDALLTKMQQLCVRMNVDKQPSSCEIAMEYLRKAFNRPEHRQTLVILDDVWSSDILRYFDVGCRLLVITKDLSVVDCFTRRKEPIEVNPFLSEAESIELFSLHLGIPIKEPDLSKAKDIHKEACGSPMMIYMIGDLLAKSRNRKSGADSWSKYAKALADRKQLRFKHTTDYQFSNPLNAIAMSFEALKKEDQERFRWFSVFMRDVNIPAKVLATIWNIDTIDVEDYMDIYIKSTIAREMWDQATEQFIYGIHDFVLEYLKQEVPVEETQVLHRKIIERYQEGHRLYHEFPDDNYIYYFIGYHLDHSGQITLFPEVYLDIRFIAAKLRATGPGDLLNDMDKYEGYISGNGNVSSYQDFLLFIKHHGSYIAVHPRVDVIQLALLEPVKSAVYRNAVEIARLDRDNYYEWCNREGDDDSHCKYLVSTMAAGNVTTALLTRDERRVLVAISGGPIKLIDTKNSRLIYTFTGHLDSVNHLALSPDGGRFVSASKDRTCMVWDLEKVLKELDESLRPNKTPSPRSRQDSHFKMFNKDDNERDPCLLVVYPQSLQVENPTNSTEEALDPPIDHLDSTDEADGVQLASGEYETDSKITAPSDIVLDVSALSLSNNSAQYTWAEFSNSGTCIVCTISSSCCLWNSRDGIHFKELFFDDEVSCCTFNPSDKLLAVASEEEVSLFMIDDWSTCIFRSCNTRHLRFIDDTRLISVSVNGAELWDCPLKTRWKDRTQLNNVTRLFQTIVKTSAIHHQGHRIAIADETNRVRIFDIQSRKFTGHRRCRSGKIICLAFGLNHYMIAGTEDCMLVIWEMETEQISDVLPGGYEMDARWTSEHPESLEIARVSRQDIQVKRGLTTIEVLASCSEEDSSIIACAFTASSKNVAWATESNQIKMMSLTSGEVATVGSHDGSMINIMKFGPKGKVLATVGKDGTMMLWTRSKDKDQESRGSPCFVGRRINIPRLEVFQFYFVFHSVDGSSKWSCGSNKKDDLSVLVVHSDGTTKVWLCATGKLVDTKCSNLGLSLRACDISCCNMYLAMGDETSGLRQFRLQEPKISISLAKHANKDVVVSTCRYSPDENCHYLAVGYNSGAFELWDFADGQLLHMLSFHSCAVKDILFATSNPKLLVSISDKIAMWNLAESGKKKSKTYNKKSWSPMPEAKTFEFNSCIIPVQTVELPCTGTTIKIRGNADLSTLVAMTDLGSIYVLKRF